MAEGTKLVMEFYDTDGRTVQFSITDAKPSTTEAQVKTLMEAMVTNTQVFAKSLTARKSAKLVTTSETPFDVTDEAAQRFTQRIDADENTPIAIHRYDPITGQPLQ